MQRRAAVREPDSGSDSDDEGLVVQKLQLKKIQHATVESVQVGWWGVGAAVASCYHCARPSALLPTPLTAAPRHLLLQVLSARGRPSSHPGSRPLSRQGSGVPAGAAGRPPSRQDSLGAVEGRNFRIMASHQAGMKGGLTTEEGSSRPSSARAATPSRLVRSSAAAPAAARDTGLHTNPLFNEGDNLKPSWVQASTKCRTALEVEAVALR